MHTRTHHLRTGLYSRGRYRDRRIGHGNNRAALKATGRKNNWKQGWLHE